MPNQDQFSDVSTPAPRLILIAGSLFFDLDCYNAWYNDNDDALTSLVVNCVHMCDDSRMSNQQAVTRKSRNDRTVRVGDTVETPSSDRAVVVDVDGNDVCVRYSNGQRAWTFAHWCIVLDDTRGTCDVCHATQYVDEMVEHVSGDAITCGKTSCVERDLNR